MTATSSVSTPRSSSRSRSFPHVSALDGLRGLAAVAVVFHHCIGGTPPLTLSGWSHDVQVVASYFYLGVDLFFVLSGYLITNLLLIARRQRSYYHDFYWKRVFRILPALLLVLVIIRLFFQAPWPGIWIAVLFVANFAYLLHLPAVGPFWTLSIEEQFYLLWPSVVHRTRPRTIVAVVFGLILLPTLLRVLGAFTGHNNSYYTPLHCDGLAWGALLAILCYLKRVPFRRENEKALWRRVGRWALASGLVLLVMGVANERLQDRDYGLILTAAGPLFSGVLLYLLANRESFAARGLSARPMRFLGDISYMLYLSHPYIMFCVDDLARYWSSRSAEANLYFRFVIVLVLSIAWSAVSLHAFERPIGRLRRFVLRRA